MNPLLAEVLFLFLILKKPSYSLIDKSSAHYVKEPHTEHISTLLVETYPTVCTEPIIHSGEKDQFNKAKCIQKLIWSFFNCLFRHKSNAAQLLVEARVQPTSSKHVSMLTILVCSLGRHLWPTSSEDCITNGIVCPILTLCKLRSNTLTQCQVYFLNENAFKRCLTFK